MTVFRESFVISTPQAAVKLIMLHVSAHIAADKSFKAHGASKSGAASGTPIVMRTMAEQVAELKRRQKENMRVAMPGGAREAAGEHPPIHADPARAARYDLPLPLVAN